MQPMPSRLWSGPGKRASRRGAALLVAVILLVVIVGYAAALMATAQVNAQDATSSLKGEQALAIANSGAMRAIAEIASCKDADGDGWGWLSGKYGGGSYQVATEAIANGEFRVVSSGTTAEGVSRTVEMILRPGPILPSVDAAIGLYGRSIATKGAGEAEFEVEADKGSSVLVSGIDPSGGPAVPAVGIEAHGAYVQVMEKLSEQLAKGEIPASTFEGSPITPYTNSKGQTVAVPIAETPNPRLNSDLLESLRQLIFNTVRDQVIPKADIVIDKSVKAGTYTWGTPAAPKITVVNGTNLHVENGATINGAGILVVTKDWHLEHATVNWQGSIVVLGDAKQPESKFENHHAVLNVQGNILAIGGDNGKAEFKLHNDDHKNDATSTVTGTILVLSGAKKEEGAEFEVEHGGMTVNGVIAVLGQESEIEIEPKAEGGKAVHSFALNGAMVAAVPNDAGGKEVELEVELEGNVKIQYNRKVMESALNGLTNFTSMLKVPPQYYAMAAWRQLPAVSTAATQAQMSKPPVPVFGGSSTITLNPSPSLGK